MVKIGTLGPRIFPGQIQTFATAGEVNNTPHIETDTVGQGYPDATPIVVPPGSAPGAVVNTTPKVFQGILPRHNTPSAPPEQGGKVMMDLVNRVYIPRIQFTPPEVQP